MKKLLGILLALASFVFLVWCLLSFQYRFGVRMLFNIIGFAGFAGGLYLAGVNLFGFGKPQEPYERKEERKTPKKKEQEKVELKKFEEEDHDRYRPK